MGRRRIGLHTPRPLLLGTVTKSTRLYESPALCGAFFCRLPCSPGAPNRHPVLKNIRRRHRMMEPQGGEFRPSQWRGVSDEKQQHKYQRLGGTHAVRGLAVHFAGIDRLRNHDSCAAGRGYRRRARRSPRVPGWRGKRPDCGNHHRHDGRFDDRPPHRRDHGRRGSDEDGRSAEQQPDRPVDHLD